MKRKLFSVAIVVFALASGLVPLGTSPTYALQSSSLDGTTAISGVVSYAVGLTADEIAGLKYMREEEKLARDVYTALYAKWSLSIFYNISRSEQKHMDAVKTLLDRYGIPDPAYGKGPGQFTDPYLQALYNDLVSQGMASRSAALKVGGAIEEIDIIDLRLRIKQTNKTDITNAYTNLTNGSYNHLRAFVSALKQQTGEDYVPQYLSEADYNAIISGDGGGGGAGGGCRGHCGG